MNAAAIASIGIDLGKTTFHLVALDCQAKVNVRKKFSRSQLLAYTANLPWSLIGMEARVAQDHPTSGLIRAADHLNALRQRYQLQALASQPDAQSRRSDCKGC